MHHLERDVGLGFEGGLNYTQLELSNTHESDVSLEVRHSESFRLDIARIGFMTIPHG